MAIEKKKRHEHGHDHHKHHKKKHELSLGEQSDQATDMPQSQQQMGDENTKLAKKLNAEIVAVSDGAGGAKILIDRGSDDGIEVGTVGYVIGPHGENFADFKITEVVGETQCYGLVEGIDAAKIKDTPLQVVLNP